MSPWNSIRFWILCRIDDFRLWSLRRKVAALMNKIRTPKILSDEPKIPHFSMIVLLLVAATAFMSGYVAADDQRIEACITAKGNP